MRTEKEIDKRKGVEGLITVPQPIRSSAQAAQEPDPRGWGVDNPALGQSLAIVPA